MVPGTCWKRDGWLLSAILLALACAAHTLTGPNVCYRDRLVPVASVYNLSEMQYACEDVGLTATVCKSVISGVTDYNDIFVIQPVRECCDGFYPQDGVCQPCPPERYGSNCSLACPCLNRGTCDSVTGRCMCGGGWTGTLCEERCSSTEYGPNCSLPCQATCENGGVCHPSLGHCLCDFGWDGPTCSASCSVPYCSIDSDLCSNGATFDPAGFCMCRAGWQGRYCTEPCPNGTYGAYCKKACRCENGGLCDQTDGSCRCPPGFWGTFCENPCDAGFYGQGCQLPCDCPDNVRCDSVDGACRKCPIGYTGPSCTAPCEVGSWGPTCRKPCDCNVQARCDRFTGKCVRDEKPTSSASPTAGHDQIPAGTGGQRPSTLHPSQASFLIPVIVCAILAIVVILLVVVIVTKRLCRKQPTVRTDMREGTIKLNHEYADQIVEKGESEYAEIDDLDLGYEVPKIVDLEKSHTVSRQRTLNYYQPPPERAPPNAQVVSNNVETKMDQGDGGYHGYSEVDSPKTDSNGYLHLTGGREPSTDYQKIKTNGGFFSR